MDFPEKVRRLLKRRRASQAALARSIGVAAPRITEWLDPEDPAKPSIYQLRDMARFLGCTADFLLDDAQDELPEPETERMVAIRRAVAELGEDEAFRRLLAPAGTGAGTGGAVAAESGDLFHGVRQGGATERRRKEGA